MNKRDSIQGYVYCLSVKIITYTALALTGMLSVISMLVTTSADYSESSYTVSLAKCIPTLIGIIISVAAILMVKKNEKTIPSVEKVEAAGFMFGLVASTLWIFIANTEPVYDSASLIQAAQALLGNQEYQTTWMHGGYMWRYSFQTPYVLLIVAAIKIAGENFNILLQLSNAFANAFTILLLVRITNKLSSSKVAPLIALLLSSCFFGTIYYSTWEYGNLLGNTLLLASAVKCIEAFDGSKIQISKTISSVLFMVFACLIKSTLAIAAIALGITFFLLGLKRKRYGLLPLLVMPYVLYSLVLGALNAYVGSITGCDFSGEIPLMSHVTMGTGGGLEWEAEITGNDEIAFATEMPGFYNGYVNQLDKDEEYYSVANKYYLKKRLERYEEYPDLFARFFCKKLLIEWTDPTFGSLIESNWDRDSVDIGASTRRSYTAFARSFYYGKANIVTTALMDIDQSLIAIGAFFELLSLVFSLRGHRIKYSQGIPNISNLFLIIFVIGGFILYIFWEDKSQYIMPFYIAMLPYAACGLSDFADYFFECMENVVQ